MKIKSGVELEYEDFWYDLTDGGYLDPYDVLENTEDADKVAEAIQVLLQFQNALDDAIEAGFEE